MTIVYSNDPTFKLGDLVIYVCYQFVFTVPLTELVKAHRREAEPGADNGAKPHPFAPATTMLDLSEKRARQLLADAEPMADEDREVGGAVAHWQEFCDEAANQTHEGMALGEALTKPRSEFIKGNTAIAIALKS